MSRDVSVMRTAASCGASFPPSDALHLHTITLHLQTITLHLRSVRVRSSSSGPPAGRIARVRLACPARCALLAVIAASLFTACRSVPHSSTTATPAATPSAATAPAAPSSARPGAEPPPRAHLEPQPLPAPVLIAPATTSALEVFRTSVDSMLNDAAFRNANWGVLIVNAAMGDTLYARNADKLFMPASNQKLITTAVALTQLGPTYRWRTTVELRGVTSGHTFTGDVVVHGRGDPTWSDALRNGAALSAFAPIADAFATRGITHVVGRVIAEDNVFSDSPYGFGWAYDDFDDAYSAPVDELMMNEGFFTLSVRAPRKLAAALSVTTAPTHGYPRVLVQAVARQRGDSLGANHALEAKWDSTASAVVVRGTLPMGDSTSFQLPYRHPNDAVLAAICDVLAARGVSISTPEAKRSSVRAEPVPGALVAMHGVDTLVVLVSPALRDVLKRLAKPSQNQLAEALFKTTALEVTGVGRADSARAVVERQLAAWGIAGDAVAVRDGSGLSRHDYVTPRAIVQVLNAMRQSVLFEDYAAELPIAGIDGTLSGRMKGTTAANNVRAKTGTIDKARSLSGYVTTADGQLLLFSFLCNNFTVPTRAVERVQDAIAVQLSGLHLRNARLNP